jgi:hypothetical protein
MYSLSLSKLRIISNKYSCTLIDKQQRLYDDPEVVCYEGIHYLVATGAGLPGLILWVIGIPFYGFMQMKANRLNLSSVKVKE